MSDFKPGDVVVLKDAVVDKISDYNLKKLFGYYTVGKPYTVFEYDDRSCIRSNAGDVVVATAAWFKKLTPEEIIIANILFS